MSKQKKSRGKSERAYPSCQEFISVSTSANTYITGCAFTNIPHKTNENMKPFPNWKCGVLRSETVSESMIRFYFIQLLSGRGHAFFTNSIRDMILIIEEPCDQKLGGLGDFASRYGAACYSSAAEPFFELKATTLREITDLELFPISREEAVSCFAALNL